ncbi:MAG: hypothetical protein RJB13_1526 [Pseudomonadota bacterium]|jgi:hypothetical protein
MYVSLQLSFISAPKATLLSPKQPNMSHATGAANAEPGSASSLSDAALPKNTETLKNLNASTAKFAVWFVRIIDPKIIEYTFTSRSEQIKAQKFQCVLVSNHSEQYMMGLVPFEFRNRNAAQQAASKFTANSVWQMMTPAIDAKARAEYNGCPLKSTVLLTAPTKLKAVPPTNIAQLQYPAKGLKVILDIKTIVSILKAPGAFKRLNKTFDFCGKITALSDQKKVVAGGSQKLVAEATFIDSSGGEIDVSVWNESYAVFKSLTCGQGVCILGCNATEDKGNVKLNVWPNSHVCVTGDQAQSLTSLDAKSVQTEKLTAKFTPGDKLEDLMENEAHPTCAAALRDASGLSGPITFQINRCLLEPPLQEDLLLTQDGRPFIRNCRVRDCTGCVEVDVVKEPLLKIFDCSTEDDFKTQLQAQSLTSLKCRVNIRGVMRDEGGTMKKYLIKMEPSPLDAVVSRTATRLSLGLSSITDNVVVAAPGNRICDIPLLGMALRRDVGEPVGAYRLILLLKGTCDSTIDIIDETLPMNQQTFKVKSLGTTCLLSEVAVTVNLVGYCNFKGMLTYRLDKETALVLISSVTINGDASIDATVEHMHKISKDETASLMLSMNAEWKSLLVPDSPDQTTPQKAYPVEDSSYWSGQRAVKMRRLESEPKSPVHS